ncbi:MAG: saccharopine dehydrogenase NADP-binding domain-containing protein [Leptospiraceae bacterium]|nr:saccharopine dehydrogenase NADP-binding domain-containing protein [Leptospiraceae bacterium]MCP5501873.1 saccharopine dehydrogenase NADP-binding domain-containing protein [Leptospiraceae bacterium]
MKTFILGGYGNTGYLISRLLLQHSNTEIVIGARNKVKVEEAALSLNQEFNTNRVSFKELDAGSRESLKEAFRSSDIVVVASSTIEFTKNVVEACLDSNCDYLDLQLSSPSKHKILEAFKGRINSDKRCFITDGGFHPGVPAAMVRYAATQFENLSSANVYGAFRINWKELKFSESTILEFVDELKYFDPKAFIDKEWKQMSYSKVPKYDFGKNFREQYATPMYMKELDSLPSEIPSLKETGFYIAGFNPFTDYFVLPLTLLLLKVLGEASIPFISRFFFWSLKTFTKPPFAATLQLLARGRREGQAKEMKMVLEHEEAYVLTAVPVVACLLQYFSGNRKEGLHFQAQFVEPETFFKDIERLGIRSYRS